MQPSSERRKNSGKAAVGAEGSDADHRLARKPAGRRVAVRQRRQEGGSLDGGDRDSASAVEGAVSFPSRTAGLQAQEFARVFHEDDKQPISEWEPLEPKGIDWAQDFEAAKKTAASEHKNVLIFFDASDAKESSFASGRFKEAVAKRKEFRERADKEYVCVYIDNPKNAEAQGEVKDADRNGKLTEKFGIKVFPTVVVTDPKGRPFGVLEGYKINGITAFLGLMDKWAADGKQLFAVARQVRCHAQGESECRPRRRGPRFPGD